MAITDALRAQARELFPTAVLTPGTGTQIELGPEDIVSFEIQEGADSALMPGNVVSAACSLVLDNSGGRWLPDSGEDTPLRGATAQLWLNVRDGETWRRAALGAYVISGVSAEEQRPVIRLTGSDSIATELAAEYLDRLIYPTTLSALWNGAVGQTRYAWSGTVPNGGAVIDARPDWNGATLRQVLGYVAAAAGCFVCVDREGALRLAPCRRDAAEAELSPGAYMALTRGFESYGPVIGLEVTPEPDADGVQETFTLVSGTPETVGEIVALEGNPLFMQGRQHMPGMAQGMLAQLEGLRLAKAEFRWRGDPAVGVGSRLRLTDTRGEAHLVTVTRQTLRWSGGFSATCACETPGGGGAGVPRVITPEGGLKAEALVGRLDGGLLRAGTVAARSIAAQAITTEKLAAGAITAEKIDAGAITAEKIDAGAITTEKLDAGAITADKIDAGAITAEKLAAHAIDADAIAAIRADIRELVAGTITTDQLYADLATIATAQITTAHMNSATIDWASITSLAAEVAEIAQAEISQATIGTAQIENLSATIATIATAQITTAALQNANIQWANISNLAASIASIADAQIGSASITTAQITDLTAQIASVVNLAAQNGDFNFAKVASLVAGAMILSEGVGGSVCIDNLSATSAMMVSATLGELVLKGTDNKYYNISVDADGTLHTQQTTVTSAEISAGETSTGKAIVGTSANIASLNAQTIKAQSAIISSIFAAALEADKISANQAFLASAAIPELRATVISALEDKLTLKGSQVIFEAGDTTAEGALSALSSRLTVSEDGLSQVSTHMTEVDGTVDKVNSFFRFDLSDATAPVLTMGSTKSPMSMKLSNTKLSFLWNGSEVAYFSDNKLYVTNVEAIERLSVGTTANGYLDEVTTATGVGFLWRAS